MATIVKQIRREVWRQHEMARATYCTYFPRSMQRRGSAARRELAREAWQTRRVLQARWLLDWHAEQRAARIRRAEGQLQLARAFQRGVVTQRSYWE